jgi:hypothetical protein
MSFPASSIVPTKEYVRAKEIAHTLDQKMPDWISQLSVDVDADTIWMWFRELYTDDQAFAQIASVPGIVDYAIAQESDPTLDIIAEFSAMRSAVQAAGTWIYQKLPRDANGYVLIYKTTAAAEMVPRVFAPSDTVDLIPLLQAIDNAIA